MIILFVLTNIQTTLQILLDTFKNQFSKDFRTYNVLKMFQKVVSMILPNMINQNNNPLKQISSKKRTVKRSII